jgi:hypothetical protein
MTYSNVYLFFRLHLAARKIRTGQQQKMVTSTTTKAAILTFINDFRIV